VGWLETMWWIYVGSFIFLLPFVIKNLMAITWLDFAILAILGLATFFSVVTHFKALEIGKLSVVEIILSFELPLTIILGVVFLNNQLFFYQIALIATLFSGVALLSIDFNRMHRRWFQFLFFWQKKRIVLERGVILAILTAILLSLTSFFTAVGATRLDPILVIWLSWTLGGIVCLAYLGYQKKIKSTLKGGSANWRLILIMVIVDIAAWLFFTYSLSAGEELVVVAAITGSYVVIAMLLGLRFNKEKIRGWQYVGAGVAFTASILIGIFSK
jgi:uncharacterized membrane protein